MTEGSTNYQDQVFDASPYLKLVIDREGRWYQNGAEIIHQAIYLTFCNALEKTADGEYRVTLGRETCRVEVEDAPFVVQRVDEGDDGKLYLLLNDRTSEPFEPEKFRIGDSDVPYTDIKDGRFHARFSRPAYYQLAEHIVFDDSGKAFFSLDGMNVPVIKKGA
jgi:uncharacterized protein